MDLKPYFDRAKSDSDEAVRLQNEVGTFFNNGTDEGIQAAIDLQPQLEAATIKAEQSNRLYVSMRNADSTTSNAASLFVAQAEEQEEETAEEKKLTLAAFNNLSPKERMTFLRAGGSIA